MMNNQSTADLIVEYLASSDDEIETDRLFDELADRAFRCPQDAAEIVHQLGWDLDSLFA